MLGSFQIEFSFDKKARWKTFMAGFKSEIEDTLKSNPRVSHFTCPDCLFHMSVAWGSLLRHRTLQGCAKIRLETKLKNWTKDKIKHCFKTTDNQ